jgi:hypothetical protein
VVAAIGSSEITTISSRNLHMESQLNQVRPRRPERRPAQLLSTAATFSS